ncbi:hypothetical protein A2U01_0055216, partial [Trifolium medium]|nr:hypothetical protein [Trifolium medium]
LQERVRVGSPTAVEVGDSGGELFTGTATVGLHDEFMYSMGDFGLVGRTVLMNTATHKYPKGYGSLTGWKEKG